MKTLIPFPGQWITALIFLASSVPVFSQAWVPLGTEWAYREHNFPENIIGISKIKAVEELMDAGRMVSKLVVESPVNCPYEPDWVYAYYTPEKEVFFKLPGDSSYIKYFDFSAQPGDQFSIPFQIDTFQEEMKIYVDSVDTVLILNEPRIRVRGWIGLKWLIFEEQPVFCWIEGIGDVYTSMFLGQSLHCDSGASSTMHGFRCFKDSEGSIYNPYNVDCDEIISNNTKELDKNIGIKFYPNPVNNVLFLDTPEFDLWTAEFLHVSGRLMHTCIVSGKSILIPESLSSGMYFIHLKDKYNNSRVLKILKD
jgi:hypothetical protein